jgi:hypothetical protein
MLPVVRLRHRPTRPGTGDPERPPDLAVRFVYSTRVLSLQGLREQHAAAPPAENGSADFLALPSGEVQRSREAIWRRRAYPRARARRARPPKRRTESGTLARSNKVGERKKQFAIPPFLRHCVTALQGLDLRVTQENRARTESAQPHVLLRVACDAGVFGPPPSHCTHLAWPHSLKSRFRMIPA